MAIAFDAVTISSGWTTTPDPFTFTHTPVGTPKGVVVVISVGTNSDVITSVTYGGVTMTRIVWGKDGTGETCGSFIYFLGSGISTGAQTVSIDHTAGTQAKVAFCYTFTAGADTEVVASNILEGDTADPQIALDSGGTTALRIFGIGSGHNSETSLTVISGMTAVGGGNNGSKSFRSDRETTPTSGSVTVGYTATSEDVGMAAVAIAEVAGGGASILRQMMQHEGA